LKKKIHFLKENFNISKNNIISVKAAKLLVDLPRKSLTEKSKNQGTSPNLLALPW
jgi:hypothetical protein